MTTPKPPVQQLQLSNVATFLWGSAALVAINVACWLVAIRWSHLVVLLICGGLFLLHIIFGGWIAARLPGLLLFATGLGVVSGGVGSYFGGHYVRAVAGTHVTEISVSEAPSHPRASSLHFADGRYVPLFYGHHQVTTSSSRSSSTRHFYVAPLVARDWDPSLPISVWAIKEEGQSQARTEFTVMVRRMTSANRTAVADAENKHQLSTVDGALLVEIVPSLQAYAASSRLWAIVSSAATLLLWLVVFWAYRAPSRKDAEG